MGSTTVMNKFSKFWDVVISLDGRGEISIKTGIKK